MFVRGVRKTWDRGMTVDRGANPNVDHTRRGSAWALTVYELHQHVHHPRFPLFNTLLSRRREWGSGGQRRVAAGTCEGTGAIGKLGSWDPDGKSWVLAMERRTLMTTTASRGTLRVTVRAASPLGAAASALLAMFRPCGELGVAHEVNARARSIKP